MYVKMDVPYHSKNRWIPDLQVKRHSLRAARLTPVFLRDATFHRPMGTVDEEMGVQLKWMN